MARALGRVRVWAWVVALCLGAAGAARAESVAFDAAQLSARFELASHTEVLRDEGHKLDLDDVSRGAATGRFDRSTSTTRTRARTSRARTTFA